MSTDTFKLLAVLFIAISLIIAGINGVRRKYISIGLGGGRAGSSKAVFELQLKNVPAQVINFSFILGGMLFLSPVLNNLLKLGYDFDAVVMLAGGVAVGTILTGFILGCVLQFVFTLSKALQKKE